MPKFDVARLNAVYAIRMKLLIAAPEGKIRKALCSSFEKRGYTVLASGGGRELGRMVRDSHPDALILHEKLSGTDALRFCRGLHASQETSEIAAILLAGKKPDVRTQVAALDSGFDAVIAPPHDPKLVDAVVRSVLRRSAHPRSAETVLATAGLTLNLTARTVSKKGKRIRLTRKEYDLLSLFARKPGRLLSISYLLETVWGYDPAQYNDPSTVQAHISSLRRKLGKPFRERIAAVQGLGYRFER